MSISLCCCLIAFALTSRVAADFTHKAVNETLQITLDCNPPKQDVVTWSREKNGTYSNIITIRGDDDNKHKNPEYHSRHHSLADRSLVITNVKFSDSGRYYCNNETAVELTVIPSGTTIKTVRETKKTVTLKCPDEDEGSDGLKWSRQFGEIPQQRFQIKEKKLILKDLKQEDTGLYYCGGKPAVFLNVTSRSATKNPSTTSTTIRTQRPTSKTATTTSTTPIPNEVPVLHWLILVGTLIFLIIITTACFTWRQKCKKQEPGSECHVYDEISHASVLQPDSDSPYSLIGPSCPSPFSGHNQDSPYSLIGPSSCSGNDQGSSLPANSTYILLEKPKAPTNHDEQL